MSSAQHISRLLGCTSKSISKRTYSILFPGKAKTTAYYPKAAYFHTSTNLSRTIMAGINRVVWQDQVGVTGVVRERALPTTEELGDRKVLVKVHAWAMNRCDGMLQTTALPFVKYPVILGQDIAGTVAAVAPDSAASSKFSVRDRVFGFTANNGFQDHVPLDYTLMAKIPGDIPYGDAVVFGLCITTSSFSLFGKDYLHLEYPKLRASMTGKSILVWCGSSAAGSNAIQLATGAGYDVIGTCLPHNFDYVKSLGAARGFDYKSFTVTGDVVKAVDNTQCAGIYMAAGSNAAACKVAAASKQKVSDCIQIGHESEL